MIVVSDTTPLRLEADEIRQKKFIVVKPVNNPESASIFSLSICLTASDNAAVRYVVRHVADHPRIL